MQLSRETGDVLKTSSKLKVGITDQTGANPATRQVAKGIGVALQFMAQGFWWIRL